MFGWTGKILKINLTNKSFEILKPDKSVYHNYIGGKGLAGYFLRPHINKNWQDESMPLLFFTGPLNNTPTPTSGRMAIVSKSPLTDTVGDTSVGGKFATMLKKAGFDGIIITGKSESYVGIHIENNKIRFESAKDCMGFTVSQMTKYLSNKAKGASTAIISRAAENMIRFSNIIVDEHYFAGRNGLGCISADKKLKFITVKGTGKTAIYDLKELSKAREDINRLSAASPILSGDLGLKHFGTGTIYDLMIQRRMMPTDNFKKTYFKHSENMNAYAYKKKYNTKSFGCSGCYIQCKKEGEKNKIIPEFEAMSHFSALICNNDIEAVTEANRICNEEGLDTISAAVTLACYKEIKGIQMTGDTIVNILNDIVNLKNDGELLAKGSYEYAKLTGWPEKSMSVKKLELPAYDPRGAYGMAIAYITSTRGGCHLRAYPISHEILRKPVATDRFSFSAKARIIKIAEDANAMIDSLVACKFMFFAATLEEYAKALQSVTGMQTTGQDLLKIGERIYYNDKIMNAENGFNSDDDDLPERFFKSPGSGNEDFDVPALNRKDFLKERASYYKIRGLNEKGMPLKEKAEELGLEWKL